MSTPPFVRSGERTSVQRAGARQRAEELKAFAGLTVHFFKTWVFLLYVVTTWKNCVVFTEEPASCLQSHQRMRVDSGVLLGGLGHTRQKCLPPSTLWIVKQRRSFTMKVSYLSIRSGSQERNNALFSTCRKIRHYVSIIRVCSGNNKVRKGARGPPGVPRRDGPAVYETVGTNGVYTRLQAEKRSDGVQAEPHTGTLLRVRA